MLTVALPTWKNKAILWLPLEGLARQRCEVPWELVVMECESDTKELILSYKDRLEKAGCKDITYIHSPSRMPLAIKWKMMAEKAKGKVFCLQASDDYPQPTRNQKAWNGLKNSDWFHSRYFYQYSFKYKKVILYDRDTYTANWKTGFNISLKTNDVRKIQDTCQPRGIDFYLFNQIQPKRIFYDQTTPRGGVSTDGFNALSIGRYKYYEDTKPPFVDTDKTVWNIGLPKAISTILEQTILPEEIGKFKLTGKRTMVLFKKNFKGKRAGCEYLVDTGLINYLKYRGVIGEGEKLTTRKL